MDNNMGRSILQRKYFLYATEFFSGMSVMAIELGASRLLAPYFSSSQIVWTIIIGTIMIAMALGNVWGGRLADKDPNPDRLYGRLLVAAVWTAAIPFLGKYVIIAIAAGLAFLMPSNYLVWAAFASSMVLFVFPLMLLGTVTPSLVKYTVSSLDDSGKTVGYLGALNTIGSIIGTFTPTFITIPAVGTAVTFLIFAGILFLLALLYFLSRKRRLRSVTVTAVLLVVCMVFGHSSSFAFWEDDLLYEGESVYNYLQVQETNDSIILSTNVLFGVQSIKMKEGGLTGMYYDYALAAPAMAGVDEEAHMDLLILGMGTGTYATQCETYFNQPDITGVEIDQAIVDLAAEYFDLPEDVEVHTADGRAWLANCSQTYDVIMVDAYQDITIPFQMSSVEFFTEVQEHLNEGGVMVVNMNMHSDTEDSINDYLSDTIASVFPYVYTVEVGSNSNRELFASTSPLMVENLQAACVQTENTELRSMLQTVSDNLTPYSGQDRILTDDKAPVELLGMRVIDELIADELDYYIPLIREQGISALLD